MEGNHIAFTSQEYSKKAYYIRDCYMVDNADALLCVWDGISSGGTFITRNYAIKKNKKIIDYEGLRNESKSKL